MNVLVIMGVITCAIILMVHSTVIVIQALCLILIELLVKVIIHYINDQKIVTKLCSVDINECLVDNGGCEFSCTNLVGIGGLPEMNGSGSITNSESITNETNLGYQCGCDTGYQLAPNNHNCIGNYTVCMYAHHLSQHGILDILNCLINDHNCSQICVELEGSFSCSCFSGYELQEDKANCAGNRMLASCNDLDTGYSIF